VSRQQASPLRFEAVVRTIRNLDERSFTIWKSSWFCLYRQASLTTLARPGGTGAEIAQSVERDPSKVEATSSTLVFRSMTKGAFNSAWPSQDDRHPASCQAPSVMEGIHRLTVRTPDFRSDNKGSIPFGCAIHHGKVSRIGIAVAVLKTEGPATGV
jgi:hypothetical protein